MDKIQIVNRLVSESVHFDICAIFIRAKLGVCVCVHLMFVCMLVILSGIYRLDWVGKIQENR